MYLLRTCGPCRQNIIFFYNLFYFSDASTQTPSSLTASSPRKLALKRKLKIIEQKVRRSNLPPTDSPLPQISSQDVANFFAANYSPEIANFINMQMSLLQKNPKGARYSNEYKQFALTLYFLGPKSYKFLAKTFRLPGKATLINITKKWPINPGLNEFIFYCLENQVKTMDEKSKDCTICIDEMSLHTNIMYTMSSDEIVGFHQTINKKAFMPGNNALVLMLRGINFNWKQPLSYFFVNSTCPVEDLKTIVTESIKRLHLIGLRVRLVISDQGSNFVKLTKVLGVSIETPYFLVDSSKVFYMFDVPHLLKNTRNNFFKYHFLINNNKTSKKYLNIFYTKDKLQSYRLAPKLTDAHLNPTNFQKMKVKFASQIFSATLAAALNTYISFGALESDAMHTADFIDKMDKMFDIFNSSSFKAKFFNRPFMGAEFQNEFLNEMSQLFEKLKVVDGTGKEIKVKFIYGWRLAISTFRSLWHDLKSTGVNYIFTRRLNQDCLENFFGKIRQQNGNCQNPTPIQFCRTFKKMFALQYFDQSEGTNCVEEFDQILTHLTPERIKTYEISFNQPTNFDKIILDTRDYRQLNVAQKNAFFYVGGYFIKKCLAKHSCEICEEYSKQTQELSEDTIYTSFRAYQNAANDIFGNLRSPDKAFFEYFGSCEKIFVDNFKTLAILPNVGIKIRDIILSLPFPHPCKKFPKTYFASLFVRTRIFYTLKFLNRDLLKTKSRKPRKLNILQHL